MGEEKTNRTLGPPYQGCHHAGESRAIEPGPSGRDAIKPGPPSRTVNTFSSFPSIHNEKQSSGGYIDGCGQYLEGPEVPIVFTTRLYFSCTNQVSCTQF